MSEVLNKTNEAKIRDTLVKHPDCFFCPESVEQMLATITALRARVAELEAIVTKLPKTADGVRITPGMAMYWPSDINAVVLAVWFDHTLDLQSHDESGLPSNDWKRLRAESWGYSTRAAALAAKGGAK